MAAKDKEYGALFLMLKERLLEVESREDVVSSTKRVLSLVDTNL